MGTPSHFVGMPSSLRHRTHQSRHTASTTPTHVPNFRLNQINIPASSPKGSNTYILIPLKNNNLGIVTEKVYTILCTSTH